MIVDRAQAAHAPIGNIGAVLGGNLLMTLCHEARIIPEYREWLIEPAGHQPLDMIAKIPDRPLTPPLSPEVRIAVTRPSGKEGRPVSAGFADVGLSVIDAFHVRCLHGPRVSALRDQAQQRLGPGTCFASVELTDFANLDTDGLSPA